MYTFNLANVFSPRNRLIIQEASKWLVDVEGNMGMQPSQTCFS